MTTQTPAEIDAAIAAAAIRLSDVRYRAAHRFPRATQADVDAARTALDTVAAQYTGWTRYYLVLNTGGHVHGARHCPTTYPTTRWVWLTECSGRTIEDMVTDYGDTMCTVCYPSAPVRPGVKGRLADEARAARDAARVAREADKQAKAARMAARVAKAPKGPDGQQLRDSYGALIWSVAGIRKAIADARMWVESITDATPDADRKRTQWSAQVARLEAALDATKKNTAAA